MGKYALIIVGALIFSLLTYSYALKNALFQTNIRSVQSYSQNQAFNISQSAAMLAINELRNTDKSTSNFFPNDQEIGQVKSYPSSTTFDDWKQELHGSYHLDFTLQSSELLLLESTGKFENVTNQSKVLLNFGLVPWNPEIDQALHAEQIIEMSGSDQIIGDVSINSNSAGSVDLGSGDDKITGKLFLGSGGEVDNVLIGSETAVGNGVFTISGKVEFDEPIFPEFPEPIAGPVYESGMILDSSFNNVAINEINHKGNTPLIIDTGDVGDSLNLLIGELDVQSSDIELIGDGQVSMYVNTKFNMKGNSTINGNGDVNQLNVYYKGFTEVDIGYEGYDETLNFGGTTQLNGSLFAEKANINLNGTAGIQGNIITGGSSVVINGNPNLITENGRLIFAPNAHLELKGTVDLYGSVISNTFKSNGNGVIEYVNDLDVNPPDVFTEKNFEIVYWD